MADYKSEKLEHELFENAPIGEADEREAAEHARMRELEAQTRTIVENSGLQNGGSIHASAAFWKNLLFFGSADRYLYAVDAKTGELAWKFLTGGIVAGSAYVHGDTVYFGSYDKYIYALDARDGALKWKFLTGDIVFTSQTIWRGKLYASSCDSYIYALNAETGQLVWKFKTNALSIISPLIVNDKVYVGSDDFNMYCLDAASGDLAWKFRNTGPPTNPVIVDGSGKTLTSFMQREPAVSRGSASIVFGSWGSNHVFTLDLNTGNKISEIRVPAERIAQPALYNGMLYGGSSNGTLYAMDLENGHTLWKFQTGNVIQTSPWVENGVIYFGSCDQNFYALDAATGSLLWKLRTGGAITSSPIIYDGILYFGSWDTYFYAVDVSARRIIWKFKTSLQPTPPAFIKGLSTWGRVKRMFQRLLPRKQEISIYETAKKSEQASIGVGPYKLSEPYRGEIKYKSDSPYEMKKEKETRDLRDMRRR